MSGSNAFWPEYRFLRRQVRWSGIPISFRIFHSLLWSTQRLWVVNKAEIDVFLELSCSLSDPVDIGNLISGSSAFSKTSLNIWKFTVHVLLKPDLENFEHYFASIWDECDCVVVWALFNIAFLWDWNKNWPFPILQHWWVFHIAGIFSAALLGFEIAQLEFHHLH